MSETVNTFWQGDSLPPLARACLRSFVRQGHAVRIYAYQPLEVPEGVSLADAAEILPAAAMFRFQGSIAPFTDLFRYQLLFDRGGWWVDTDVYCLTPNLPAAPRAWAPQGDGLINNAILKLPAGDPLCGRLLVLARERVAHLTHWGQIGPVLLTEVLADYAGDEPAGTRASFYPLHWLEAHYVWLPDYRAEVAARLVRATLLHFWMKALTDCGIDHLRAPPKDSWLAEATRGEVWPRLNFPWNEWWTRRALARYHDSPWVRLRLERIVRERSREPVPVDRTGANG